MALLYMDDCISGLDEDHVAHWASEQLTYAEVVHGPCANFTYFLPVHSYQGDFDELVSAVIKFAGMYWLEEGGIVFPSSKSPLKGIFKVSVVA